MFRKKGYILLLKNNISVKAKIQADDQYGRYIKIMLTEKNGKISRTISCMYLEPINLINPSTIMADISAGDLNNEDAGLTRYGVYHMKNITIDTEKKINKAISAHPILLGHTVLPFQRKNNEV